MSFKEVIIKNYPAYRLFVLILMVLIAGFSQGMLLPLLAIMLEQAGVSSALNGLNAAALYIGILLASPLLKSLFGNMATNQ